MIIEFEEEARKHIREMNEAYEQVRMHQARAIEVEQRLSKNTLQSDRLAMQEAQRQRQENEALVRKLQFVEARYETLAQ